MLALLLAVALVALTVVALLFLGVAAAVITGILMLNAFVLLIGVRSPRRRATASPSERWQPRSFRHPPKPPLDPESEEHLHRRSLTVHRR
jgi:membrane protein implicated in regulation of membrane protease activity